MTPSTLDPILSTRLELLEQALDEVDKIIKAMTDQRRRLDEVQERLKPKGMLSDAEGKLEIALTGAQSRLNVVLGPEVEPGSDSAEDDETWPDGASGLTPDGASGLSKDDEDQLTEARTLLAENAHEALWKFREDRLHAYKSFAGARRWSIAGLADRELASAQTEYRKLLSEIRKSEDPWRRYQRELRVHGQQLFTRYLELVAGMAVRGLGPDVIHDIDVRDLMEVLWPRDAPEPSASQPRSPLLMSTQHLHLGYSEWNMWTLPLSGRPIAENLIKDEVFGTSIPAHLRVLCADLYLLHVLGPSYAFAAIFIGLEPDDTSAATPPDSVRAQVIIERLKQLDDRGPLRRDLEEIADGLTRSWSQARSALNGEDTALDQTDRRIIEDYFLELRTTRTEAAYDVRWLSDTKALSKKLVADGEALNKERPKLRELLTAIWLARSAHPDKARDIHKAASKVRHRQRPGGGAPRSKRPPRLGV